MSSNRRGRKLNIPEVADLKPGEYITIHEGDYVKAQCAYNHGYYTGKKFRVLKCLEGLRIWRVK